MGKRLWAALILTLGYAGAVFASDLPPTPTPSVPKPLVLKSKEKIKDSAQYKIPRPPRNYVVGSMAVTNDEDDVPQGPALRDLTDFPILQQIPKVNKADKYSKHYYWHTFKGWNYCHYRDGDHQWYGWRTDDTFHWILWQANRFWWRDNDTGRWLYYDRGFWWWQSLETPNVIQVLLEDGHFHVSDAYGALVEDLTQTGAEDNVSGNKPFP